MENSNYINNGKQQQHQQWKTTQYNKEKLFSYFFFRTVIRAMDFNSKTIFFWGVGGEGGFAVPDFCQKSSRNLFFCPSGCTYVDGNVEISHIDTDGSDTALSEKYDFSFLKQIEEIKGYLLIYQVEVNYLPFDSLKIIRGQTLFGM